MDGARRNTRGFPHSIPHRSTHRTIPTAISAALSDLQRRCQVETDEKNRRRRARLATIPTAPLPVPLLPNTPISAEERAAIHRTVEDLCVRWDPRGVRQLHAWMQNLIIRKAG